MRVALVREAGGFGDVLTVGAAAWQRKRERPHDRIGVFVPNEFCHVAKHLQGIDEIISLGPLRKIKESRRVRDAPMEVDTSPYLQRVFDWGPDEIADCWCPGFQHEVSSNQQVYFSRAQSFALAAGVEDVSSVRPHWSTFREDREKADRWMYEHEVSDGFIGLALRGTCSCRVYPKHQAERLVRLCARTGRAVVVFDCVIPHFDVGPAVVTHFDWETFAAVLARCGLLISVDSGPMHLAAGVQTPNLILFGSTFPVAIGTYPLARPLSGKSPRCKLPCNYSPRRGWNKVRCREHGCDRMLSIQANSVYRLAVKMLKGLA
jgi:hypothetical protein